MSAARPLFRLVILPLSLLTGAAQVPANLQQIEAVVQPPAAVAQAAAQVAIPPGCPMQIVEAIRHEKVPDFRNCTYDVSEKYSSQFLKLDRKDEPDQSAPAGTVFNQDPPGGVPFPGDRTVRVFVSTGPPPPPRISGIEVTNDTVDAGKPLHFVISIKPADAVGSLHYSTVAGTAREGSDYDKLDGEMSVPSAENPPSISVTTRSNNAAAGDLTVNLRVTADTGASGIATGTIHEPGVTSCPDGSAPPCPPPPSPCTTGFEASCPPCTTGDELSCPTREPPFDFVPFLVIGLAFGVGAAAVSRFRPPAPPPPPEPLPQNGQTSPQPPSLDYDVSVPENAALPSVTSSATGPKSPIVSLVVKTTRDATRMTSATLPEDGEHG